MTALPFLNSRTIDRSSIDCSACGTARVQLPKGSTVQSLNVGRPGFCSSMMEMNGEVIDITYCVVNDNPDEFIFAGKIRGKHHYYRWKPEWLIENTLPMPDIIEVEEDI